MDNEKETNAFYEVEQLREKLAFLENRMDECQLMYDNVAAGIIKVGINDCLSIDYINLCALKTLGYTQDQFDEEIGNNFIKIIHDVDKAKINDYLSLLYMTSEPLHFYLRVLHRDGITVSLYGTAISVDRIDGRRIGIFTFNDTALFQYMEQEGTHFTSLLDNIVGGLQICERSNNFPTTYVNEGFERLTGYTKEEIYNNSCNINTMLILPDEYVKTHSEIEEQLDLYGTYTVEYRIRRKDGNIIWILDNGNLRKNPSGIEVIYSFLTDITSQKEKENALLISEGRHEIAMSFSDLTVFDYDMHTKKITNSAVDVETYKVPAIMEDGFETLINCGIIAPKSVSAMRKLLEKIDSGVPVAGDTIILIDNLGKEHIVEMVITNIFDNDGRAIYAIGVKKDVTQTFLLEREKEYVNTLTINKQLTYEANISKDLIIYYDNTWANLLGITDVKSLSLLVSTICSKFVDPEYVDIFTKMTSIDYLLSAYYHGEHLVSFDYRRKMGHSDYEWYKKTINIIQDSITHDIYIRVYIENINERKQKEIRSSAEQKYYEVMLSKSATVYEINVTKNIIISGNENWDQVFKIPKIKSLSEAITTFYKNIIHLEDREEFYNCFQLENMLNSYANNETEIICEYRRPDNLGKFIWARCTMHLFESINSSDIRAFAYVEDINGEKVKELELIFKSQYDMLTNFYNKNTVEEKVELYFSTSEAKLSKHAFFIVDFDNFKLINDNLGHAFGDVVLSQISNRIKNLFRQEDILGRIGGDEFIILMKNISDIKQAENKAQELCEQIKEIYVYNGVKYLITISIGIAIYNKHGCSYKELYEHSDTALYYSKDNGKNTFTIYSDNMHSSISNVNEINQNDLIEVRKFEDNITEYVFRILYESSDKVAAINSVLEMIGKHHRVSRTYIFEDSDDGLYTTNTFEWCNEGIESQMCNLQNIPYKDLSDYKSNFNSDGIFYMPDINNVSLEVRQILAPQSVKSMQQFSIVKNGEFCGFIGFDYCGNLYIPSKSELADSRNIANILGVFIVEMRALESSQSLHKMSLSIVNGLDSYAYVCNPETYKILFINNSALSLAANAKVGEYCYSAFWNRTTPCKSCPMKQLLKNNGTHSSMDLYNDNLNVWIKATASWVDWIGDTKACLINSVDITEYKI